MALAKAFGCARLVWNDALALRKRAYQDGVAISPGDVAKRVTTVAKKTPQRAFLSEVSAVVLQQSLRDLDTAYKNFFESVSGKRKGPKAGPPRFKKRASRQSIRVNRNAFSLTQKRRLYVAKVGDLKVRWSRELPAVPSSVTVIKTAAGRYFASFVIEVAAQPLPVLSEDQDTGIDLGLSSFAVLRGRVIASPRFLRQAERRIRKAQRELARKRNGSANRRKTRVKLAKAHARVANRRRDFIEQETTRIVRENQAVYVEDLYVKGMAVRRGRRGKSVGDQALGAFTRTLEAKCARFGRGFAKVGRWFPSTQLCSACGTVEGPKGLAGLKARTWVCGCGAVHDRDANAEHNIRAEGRRVLAEGRSERLNARGAQVRPVPVPAPRVETGTRRGVDRAKAESPAPDTRKEPGL